MLDGQRDGQFGHQLIHAIVVRVVGPHQVH